MENRRIRCQRCATAAVLLLALSFPLRCRGCEPILPLAQLLGGSSLAGPALLTRSSVWLAAAVAIKCGAFAVLERRLTWRSAVLYMLIANVVSTIPGVLVAAFTASMSGSIFALPLVFFLGWMVERRLSKLPRSAKFQWVSGGAAALAFISFFIISLILFELAGSALEQQSFATYWVSKFFFVATAACTGIVISAVVEECCIARFSRASQGNVSFFASVFRANYVTLGLVLLVSALEMLPKRLNDQHFIVSRLKSLAAMVGLS